MLRKVKLYGHLEQFGSEFELDIDSVAECVRALSSQLPGFSNALKDGSYRVIRVSQNNSMDLEESQLSMSLGSAAELHIKPVLAGAKGGGGAGKMILGVAMVAIGAVTYNPYLIAAGVGVLGAAAFAAQTPQVASYDKRESPDERPSFLFDGPVNTSAQGAAVPLVYGEMRTGSVVVSAGIAAEEV